MVLHYELYVQPLVSEAKVPSLIANVSFEAYFSLQFAPSANLQIEVYLHIRSPSDSEVPGIQPYHSYAVQIGVMKRTVSVL